MTERLNNLSTWLQTQLGNPCELTPLAGDASQRRYFRVKQETNSFIAMDAPPEQENLHPFVAIAETFSNSDIIVPKILAKDLQHGFLLLADLGEQHYFDALNLQTAEKLYEKAFTTLLKIQACNNVKDWQLPLFDEVYIQRELQLFTQWFLDKHLALSLSNAEKTLLDSTFTYLTENIIAQPRVCVHRDFQSRNLMLLTNDEVAVLDFQDAMFGPPTYDVAALLKDCYIAWPQKKVNAWAIKFYKMAVAAKQLPDCGEQQFLKWFDITGMQRHIKDLGNFARLKYYYNKPDYLEQNLPRMLNYVTQVTKRYSELNLFNEFLQEKVL